jgi:hypothetical protein
VFVLVGAVVLRRRGASTAAERGTSNEVAEAPHV